MSAAIRQCQRCGTCCRRGGPALHRQDLPLVDNGPIRWHQLITIRAGEPAHDPVTGNTVPLATELVKLAGTAGQDWACCFYQPASNTCRIYATRPLECRLLQCWDTARLTAVIGKETLSRTDIIDPDEPMLLLMQQHENHCSCSEAIDLAAGMVRGSRSTEPLARLTELVRRDLDFRQRICREFALSVAVEQFILGRPLFKILAGYGLITLEQGNTIRLAWQRPTD